MGNYGLIESGKRESLKVKNPERGDSVIKNDCAELVSSVSEMLGGSSKVRECGS